MDETETDREATVYQPWRDGVYKSIRPLWGSVNCKINQNVTVGSFENLLIISQEASAGWWGSLCLNPAQLYQTLALLLTSEVT
jgi:hypothetical protein